MKYIILLLISISAYAEILTMEDGKCYERKGSMNYIVPCEKKIPSRHKYTEKRPTDEKYRDQQSTEEKKEEECILKIAGYTLKFIDDNSAVEDKILCDDSIQYIKTMFLGYDKSLCNNKKKIGKVIARKGFSQCSIELYADNFVTIGLMSGDRHTCDDFMISHSY
ncbi:MAG: hypothetical protein U9R27_04855 [Campylobacterota bacterium]|nr:hypothetical protein [Campylobacterota bacterium]